MVDIETVHIEYRTSELYCDYLMGKHNIREIERVGEVISCLVKGRQ